MILRALLRRFHRGNAAAESNAVEHKGCTIVPAPKKDRGRFYTAGYIRKTVDGEQKETHFIRADSHSNADAARDHAVTKGRQIIDEQGERLFT